MNQQEQLTEIDRLTAVFQQEFGVLSQEQLNWKPDAATWSIAQNIDHLIVINETYYPVIASVRSGDYMLPLMGRIGFMVRALGKAILNSVEPTRKKKIKTFNIWQPAKSEISGDIVDRFAQHQEELKELIRNSADLVAKETVISSPANKNIVYKLGVAFDIIIVHEARHLEQAREILALIRTSNDFNP